MGVFDGPVTKRHFTSKLELLRSRTYHLAGCLVRWSVLNGGPGLPALNPILYELMTGKECQAYLNLNEQIPNMSEPMKSNLEAIMKCCDEAEYAKMMLTLTDWLMEVGIG
jgi:hypothetical protein